MNWIDKSGRGLKVTAKAGIFELIVYVPVSGGWYDALDCQQPGRTPYAIGKPHGPYDSMATAKRAAVRSINTIIQAARGDLLEDEAGGKK